MAIDNILLKSNLTSNQNGYISKKSKAEQRINNLPLDKFERKLQMEEVIYERKQSRKSKKGEQADSAPSAPEAPAEAKPVVEDKEAKTYAERYVALYEKNAGRTLTEEQRSAKIKEVAEFYSTASRTGRLENLVNQLS